MFHTESDVLSSEEGAADWTRRNHRKPTRTLNIVDIPYNSVAADNLPQPAPPGEEAAQLEVIISLISRYCFSSLNRLLNFHFFMTSECLVCTI